MRVLLAGASGLIGAALAQSLIADGHLLRRLVRRPVHAPAEVSWHPESGDLDAGCLDGVDAVVCLSGAGVGDHRWTPSYQRAIRESRVSSVSTLARALAAAAPDVRPPALLSASAVGYYGDTGDRATDEQGDNGTSFLASVCADWEQAAQPAADAGVRVVALRTGLVLARGAGLLGRMVPLFRAGAGGHLGDGHQYWPWISLDDEVGAIRFLLDATDLAGPVNLTAPAPATNLEFTAALAHVLHRPAVIPTPAFALRLALGEFADEVLASQRVVPARLLGAGYRFQHPDLDSALRVALAG